MANKIQVKRSAVQNKVPLTTDLDLGEIAINTYDGKLYLKKDNGTPSIVEVGASGSVSDGDKGDITVSNSGGTWTIDSGVVGTSKLGGDITTAGKALLDDADAAAQRTTLGLGTLATQSGTFSGTSSGTNTGDQTISLTGDVTGSGTGSFAATIANNAVTDAKLRQSAGLSLIGRSQSTTGNVADITGTADQVLRVAGAGASVGFGAIDVSKSAAVTGILGSANGGTANGFTAFTGPATSTKTFTLPDASSTILTSNAAVSIAQGGTGATDATTARTNLTAAKSGANTDITSVYLNNTGLKLKDTNESHGLTIAPGSDLTADRTLTVTTGDAARTLTISGNATVSQDYSTTGNPQFASIELGATDTTLSRSSAGVLAVENIAVVLTGKTDTITVGYTVTPFSNGTKSSGTFTPSAASGNYQYYTNGGAHTLAAPSADCAIDLLVTNSSTAGTITFSGFQVQSGGTGDAYATTNGNDYIISIRRINAIATYIIKALQ